jgi:DNA-binding NarL/FixJ family response regulator
VARKHFFQRLWEHIQHALLQDALPGQDPVTHRYHLDMHLVKTLHGLAQTEQRPVQDVASDLLVSELVQQQAAQDLWLCWSSLTPREQDIVALVCLGYTNNQIANRLYVSPSTIKTHARNAYSKFSLQNRDELRYLLSDWDFSQWDSLTPGD